MGNNTSSQGSNIWRSFPNNFVYSGERLGSSAGLRGGYGIYWSSTAYGGYHAYFLHFNGDYVSPATSSRDRVSGFSVRCVVPVQ